MLVHVLIQVLEGLVILQRAIRQNRGLRGACQLHICGSWKELAFEAQEDRIQMAVVQPLFATSDQSEVSVVNNLGRIEAALGPEGLILFLGQTGVERAILAELAAFRFPFVLIQGIDDDPPSILRLLARAEIYRMIRKGEATSDNMGSLRAYDPLTCLLTGWPPMESVGRVAEKLGVSPRTLRRQMAELGLFPPQRAIRWSRLLEAAVFWRMGIRSKKRIASLAGLANVSTLAHLCRDLTGAGLDDILIGNGPEEVLRSLRRDLSA